MVHSIRDKGFSEWLLGLKKKMEVMVGPSLPPSIRELLTAAGYV
jgi:hypothetical protein